MINWLSGLAASVIVALAGYLLRNPSERFRNRRRSLLATIVDSSPEGFHVFIPNLRAHTYETLSGQTIRRQPANIPMIPIQDARAMAKLHVHIQSLWRKVPLDALTGEVRDSDTHPRIILGGPVGNEHGHKYVGDQFDLMVNEDEMWVEIEGHRLQPKYTPDGDVLHDFGLILLCRDQSGVPAVNLFGVWGPGTLAAVEQLVRLSKRGRAYKDLLTGYRDHGRAWAVFEGSVNKEGIIGAPRLKGTWKHYPDP